MWDCAIVGSAEGPLKFVFVVASTGLAKFFDSKWTSEHNGKGYHEACSHEKYTKTVLKSDRMRVEDILKLFPHTMRSVHQVCIQPCTLMLVSTENMCYGFEAYTLLDFHNPSQILCSLCHST